MFINPKKSLAPWVLALDQEFYLSYIEKLIKNTANYRIISLVNLDHNIYITISKSHAKTFDTVIAKIGKNSQLPSKKNYITSFLPCTI